LYRERDFRCCSPDRRHAPGIAVSEQTKYIKKNIQLKPQKPAYERKRRALIKIAG